MEIATGVPVRWFLMRNSSRFQVASSSAIGDQLLKRQAHPFEKRDDPQKFVFRHAIAVRPSCRRSSRSSWPSPRIRRENPACPVGAIHCDPSLAVRGSHGPGYGPFDAVNQGMTFSARRSANRSWKASSVLWYTRKPSLRLARHVGHHLDRPAESRSVCQGEATRAEIRFDELVFRRHRLPDFGVIRHLAFQRNRRLRRTLPRRRRTTRRSAATSSSTGRCRH